MQPVHLPELHNLQGDEEGDGDEVRVQDPEGDEQDQGVRKTVLVVALHVGVHAQLVAWVAGILAPYV